MNEIEEKFTKEFERWEYARWGPVGLVECHETAKKAYLAGTSLSAEILSLEQRDRKRAEEKVKDLEDKLTREIANKDNLEKVDSEDIGELEKKVKELETSLGAERISVDELSLALQESEKKIKERPLCEVCWQMLEADGSCLACRLEKKVKELEELLIEERGSKELHAKCEQ